MRQNDIELGHLPYRRGVGMMLFNPQGYVFVAKRLDMTSEAWQMPQGGIDAGEDAKTAALRELQEEIGVTPMLVEFLGESRSWLRYDLPPALVPKIWGGKYRGQEQRWFALRFNGTDANIDIKAHTHPEFSEWKWVTIEQLPELIVPFKRSLYEALVAEFKGLRLAPS